MRAHSSYDLAGSASRHHQHWYLPLARKESSVQHDTARGGEDGGRACVALVNQRPCHVSEYAPLSSQELALRTLAQANVECHLMTSQRKGAW